MRKLIPYDRKKNARKNRWRDLLCQLENRFNNKLKKKWNQNWIYFLLKRSNRMPFAKKKIKSLYSKRKGTSSENQAILLLQLPYLLKSFLKKTDPEIQRKPEDNASSLFKFAKEKFGVELLINQDDRKPAAMKPSGKGSSSFRGAARRSGARNRGGKSSLNFNPGPDMVHT